MTKIVERKTNKDYERLKKIIGSSTINMALLKKLMQILKIENSLEVEKLFHNQLKSHTT